MANRAVAPATWLQREPSVAATARVFCIPHAGCGTNIFANWPDVRDSVEFLPVELPGRLSRFGERMPDTFEDLAAALIAGLRPYFDVPFAFFGHCWSALAAYEVSVQLERAGPAPARLFVSSSIAPQDGPIGRMLAMNDAELAADLATTIQDSGRQPHPELVSIYVKVLRADVEVSRRYRVPRPHRLSCPITAIGWAGDSEVAAGSMTGWRECGDTTFTAFAGGHHRFVDAPAELLNLLTSGVDRPPR
jgi:surfactin synthase thioesterase subunit